MLIHLLRHQQVAGAEGLCYGRTEVPLLPGHERATAQLMSRLPRGLWQVWTSPALRCRRMASVLAPLVRVEERLAELNFGRWEGRYWNAIPRPEIDIWAEDPVHRAPPGGESFLSLQQRAVDALDEVARQSAGRIPIVCTHAGVIRALLAKVRGLTLADSLSLEVPFGSVHAVEWKEKVVQ